MRSPSSASGSGLSCCNLSVNCCGRPDHHHCRLPASSPPSACSGPPPPPFPRTQFRSGWTIMRRSVRRVTLFFLWWVLVLLVVVATAATVVVVAEDEEDSLTPNSSSTTTTTTSSSSLFAINTPSTTATVPTELAPSPPAPAPAPAPSSLALIPVVGAATTTLTGAAAATPANVPTTKPSSNCRPSPLSSSSSTASSRSSSSPSSSPPSPTALFILCSVDGSIYALDAWSGELKSSSQSGSPLVTRSTTTRASSSFPSSSSDEWMTEEEEEEQVVEEEDQNYYWNEDDKVGIVVQDDEDEVDENAKEEHSKRRTTTNRSQRKSETPVMMEEEGDSMMMIHPGLDGKLYWQTSAAMEEGGEAGDSNVEFQALPVSIASLLEQPVQSCSSTSPHQCGILTASVAQNTLLALSTETGALQWSSGTTNTPTHSQSQPQQSPIAHDDPHGRRTHRHCPTDPPPHPPPTVLLQRKDLVVQHISMASGRPWWNITLGSYQAIDFSGAAGTEPLSSSSPSFSTALAQGSPSSSPPSTTSYSSAGSASSSSLESSKLPWLRFGNGGRQLVAIRNHHHNNNGGDVDERKKKKNLRDEARKSSVLWRIESPHVLSSVFAIENHAWKPIQVLDDEEDDDDDNNDDEEFDDDDDDNNDVVVFDNNDDDDDLAMSRRRQPSLPAATDSDVVVDHSIKDSKRQEQQQQHSWGSLPDSSSASAPPVPLPESSLSSPSCQCLSAGGTCSTSSCCCTAQAEATSWQQQQPEQQLSPPRLQLPPPLAWTQPSEQLQPEVRQEEQQQQTAEEFQWIPPSPSPPPSPLVVPPPPPPRPTTRLLSTTGPLSSTGWSQEEEDKMRDRIVQATRVVTMLTLTVLMLGVVGMVVWMKPHPKRRRQAKPVTSTRTTAVETVTNETTTVETTSPMNNTRKKKKKKKRHHLSSPNSNNDDDNNNSNDHTQLSSSSWSTSSSSSEMESSASSSFPTQALRRTVPSQATTDNRSKLPLLQSSLGDSGAMPPNRTNTTITTSTVAFFTGTPAEITPAELTTTELENTPPHQHQRHYCEDKEEEELISAVPQVVAEGPLFPPPPPPPSAQQEHQQQQQIMTAAVIQHPTGVGTTTVPLVQYARYASEFEEVESLGRGGFGSVVRCRNKLDGRDYAIKKVTIQGSSSSTRGGRGHHNNAEWQLQQFQQELFRVLREVKILAMLDHPNIVRYFTAWLEMDPGDPNQNSKNANTGEAKHGHRHGKNISSSFSQINQNDSTSNPDASSRFHIQHQESDETPSLPSSTSSSFWSGRLSRRWGRRTGGHPQKAKDHSFRGRGGKEVPDDDNDEDCGIIFEESSSKSQVLAAVDDYAEDDDACAGGVAKDSVMDWKKRPSRACHHDRSERMLSESVMALSSRMNEEEGDSPEPAPIILQHTLYIQMQLCRYDTVADFLVNKEARQGRYPSKNRNRNHKNKNGKNNNSSSSNNNSVDIPLALSLLLQIARAVQHVHEKGLIHRDLKPSNCFIDTMGVVKVGDFGLSRETSRSPSQNSNDDQATITHSDGVIGARDTENADAAIVAQLFGDDGVAADPNADHHVDHTAGVGTRLYASPEQTEGSSYDSSTDVYSLGIILYELCYPMYTGMERSICLSKLRQQRQFPLDWHAVVGRYFGGPIQLLITSMLDPRPMFRPTAMEVARRIQEVMGELTILSPPPPKFQKPQRSRKTIQEEEQTDCNDCRDEDEDPHNDDNDDDLDIVFLRVESNCRGNALQQTMSLILSEEDQENEGRSGDGGCGTVDILQSGMAKQASTGTTILEFALKFQTKRTNPKRRCSSPRNHRVDEDDETSLVNHDNHPLQRLVDRIEQAPEIIRVQQISAHHHCHPHHHPTHHSSSADLCS